MQSRFSLTLGDGEVVAITGLVGVGKTALAETLFGARTPVSGSMMLDSRAYAPKATRAAIDQGVFLVAKDRGDSGIVPDFNIYENVSLPFLKRISNFGISNRRAERAQARQQISALGIVCRTERDEMNTLFGRQPAEGHGWPLAEPGVTPADPRRAVPGCRYFRTPGILPQNCGRLHRGAQRSYFSPSWMKPSRSPTAFW